jgi:hypothetical protein
VVRILVQHLSTSEHILVSFTTQLPPIVSQSMRPWRIHCACWLTPIWAPMSDTVRSESIEHDKAGQEHHLRLAHFQGGWLELLHIGVPVCLLVTYKHNRRRALEGRFVKFRPCRIPITSENTTHVDSWQIERGTKRVRGVNRRKAAGGYRAGFNSKLFDSTTVLRARQHAPLNQQPTNPRAAFGRRVDNGHYHVIAGYASLL